jgi:DNA invertase Pin-like site-specific DNA recombinase
MSAGYLGLAPRRRVIWKKAISMMIFHVISAMAEVERELIKERVKAGVEIAKGENR